MLVRAWLTLDDYGSGCVLRWKASSALWAPAQPLMLLSQFRVLARLPASTTTTTTIRSQCAGLPPPHRPHRHHHPTTLPGPLAPRVLPSATIPVSRRVLFLASITLPHILPTLLPSNVRRTPLSRSCFPPSVDPDTSCAPRLLQSHSLVCCTQ